MKAIVNLKPRSYRNEVACFNKKRKIKLTTKQFVSTKKSPLTVKISGLSIGFLKAEFSLNQVWFKLVYQLAEGFRVGY